MKRREFITLIGGADGPAAPPNVIPGPRGNQHAKDHVSFYRTCSVRHFRPAAITGSCRRMFSILGFRSRQRRKRLLVHSTPCRTISTALSKTVAGGVIHVLPGSYDAFVVNKAVDIIADQGTASIVGGCHHPSGGTLLAGIYVNAGAGDVVRIRGMTINQTRQPLCGHPFCQRRGAARGKLHLDWHRCRRSRRTAFCPHNRGKRRRAHRTQRAQQHHQRQPRR